ncbi:hypothetical protein VAWG004_19800 [Aeromonas veronii]|nr:hypothetical protein VAWG004_19800 [Aeromonas veronii]
MGEIGFKFLAGSHMSAFCGLSPSVCVRRDREPNPGDAMLILLTKPFEGGGDLMVMATKTHCGNACFYPEVVVQQLGKLVNFRVKRRVIV